MSSISTRINKIAQSPPDGLWKYIAQRLDEGVDIQRGAFGDFQYKFGYNGDVGTTEETVWDEGGKYVYPASAAVRLVTSNSPTDSASASGARTVEIFGLDSEYSAVNETITLDGLSAVATQNSYLRLNRMIVRSAGGNGANAGLIYAGSGSVTSGVPTTKLARISTGENQTLMCTWTVPKDKRAYLGKVGVSSFGNTNAFLTVRLIARPEGEVFQVKDKFTVTRALNEFEHMTPVKFGPKTDLEVRATASSGTLDASAFMDMIVLDDD